MGFRVNRRTLLLIAGCVWIIAGINILRIGIVTWLNDAHYWLFKVGEAIVVFLLFFQFVFRRLFIKHSERISQKGEKNCPFSFFDVKGWIVMIGTGPASLMVWTIVFVRFPLSIVMVRTAIVMTRLRTIIFVRPPLPVIMTGTIILTGIPFAIVETVEPSIVRILPLAMPVMIFITMAGAGRTIVRIMRIIIPTSPIMDACRCFTDKTHI